MKVKFSAGLLALAVVTGPLMALDVQARTVVRQIDEHTLQVTNYDGRPPFKRSFVTINDAAEFARFEQMVDADRRPVLSANTRGAPGKSVPSMSRRAVRGSESETAEFARFELDQAERANPARMWQGAPGKGSPRLGQ